MADAIDIGEFRLLHQDDGTFWLSRHEGEQSGEGMHTTEEKLIAMLNEFWDREF